MTDTPPTLSIEPDYEYSLPLARCAQLLASCNEIQLMLGVGSAGDAFDRVVFPVWDIERFGPLVPGVVIHGLSQMAGYNGDQRGELLVVLWDKILDEFSDTETQKIDWKNDTLAWLNRCGKIRSQMKALSKTPLNAFGGERFCAIKWTDDVYPTHDYREMQEDFAAGWIRFHAFRVEWIT